MQDDLARYGKDDLIAEALRNEASDLRKFAKRIEGDLRKVERESISDYVQESENLAKLHMKIKDCDDVLANMQSLLGSFQSDLGKVNMEIKSLQERATDLSVKTNNRKKVESQLVGRIDNMLVSSELIEKITETEVVVIVPFCLLTCRGHSCRCWFQVCDAYMEYLLMLRKKVSFVNSEKAKEVGCNAYVKPVLEMLRLKAVEKIRSFLLHKIYALGKPKTNFQILQQNVLMKFKYLIQFLHDHDQEIYHEVLEEYINTMGQIYLQHFKAHTRHLCRCQVETMTISDTIVQTEESISFSSPVAVRSLFSVPALGGIANMVGASQPAPMADRSRDTSIFCLGDRDCVLKGDGVDVLMRVVAEKGKQRPEVVFKGALMLVTSGASSEQMFISEFFQSPNVLGKIFKPAFSVIDEFFKAQIEQCFDPLGLLLMIRVTQEMRNKLEQLQLNNLFPFVDSIIMILWPRKSSGSRASSTFRWLLLLLLILILILHLFRVRLPRHDLSLKGLAGTVRSANASALISEGCEKYPHHVTRRYAELTASLIQLRNAASAEMLDHSLNFMRSEIDSLMIRMSHCFKNFLRQHIFIINQVDAIITTYVDRSLPADCQTFFHQKLESEINIFVEEELVER
ncbi:vacuolar protein sorting 52B [Guillardia theta CCMP2712]|uniref:Vacuolar protein sorting 52B n=1 Tax=Guillardia theta (strain CCMP2712) TaxID=905079 RepID=L1JW90_GUITC|nr:vacuolar protein sorting 52B [Guillardia theta CCMP2712]EKX52826.1 vacuolar protein sorting 52B [Guillardia theta CCMP2712]|eukprot:XP_005839806.1 vacuolar protein sorting 52B [Guillardia theta CCMP2712]